MLEETGALVAHARKEAAGNPCGGVRHYTCCVAYGNLGGRVPVEINTTTTHTPRLAPLPVPVSAAIVSMQACDFVGASSLISSVKKRPAAWFRLAILGRVGLFGFTQIPVLHLPHHAGVNSMSAPRSGGAGEAGSIPASCFPSQRFGYLQEPHLRCLHDRLPHLALIRATYSAPRRQSARTALINDSTRSLPFKWHFWFLLTGSFRRHTRRPAVIPSMGRLLVRLVALLLLQIGGSGPRASVLARW